MKLIAAIAVSITLLASACSGSDSDSTSDNSTATTSTTVAATTTAAVNDEATTTTVAVDDSAAEAEALSTAIGASFADADNPIAATEQACIGDATVSALGDARLAEVGVTLANAASFDPALLPDLTDTERDDLANILAECLDLRQFISDAYAAGDATLMTCAFELFTAEDGRDIVRAGMNPDTEAGFDTMFDIFGKADPCFFDDQDALPLDSPEALAVAIAIAGDDGTGVPTTAENQCVGEGIVSTFGVERLAEIGLSVATVEDFEPATSPTMTDDERDVYLDALGACIDLKQFVVDVFVNFDTACLDQMLTLDDARRFFRTFFALQGDPSSETPSDVQAKFDACSL